MIQKIKMQEVIYEIVYRLIDIILVAHWRSPNIRTLGFQQALCRRYNCWYFDWVVDNMSRQRKDNRWSECRCSNWVIDSKSYQRAECRRSECWHYQCRWTDLVVDSMSCHRKESRWSDFGCSDWNVFNITYLSMSRVLIIRLLTVWLSMIWLSCQEYDLSLSTCWWFVLISST